MVSGVCCLIIYGVCCLIIYVVIINCFPGDYLLFGFMILYFETTLYDYQ